MTGARAGKAAGIVGVALLGLFPEAPMGRFANGAVTSEACRLPAGLARIQELPEGSGVAASATVNGRLWSHNDSGEPVVFALDSRGAMTARVSVAGAKLEDWEAIAVGPCAAGSCLYVADIGDNDAERERITIYRVAEPAERATSTVRADALEATYPDGAHDAETLLVGPGGRLFVVTKGDTGPVALYAFPADPHAKSPMKLERIGGPRAPGQPSSDDRITDGSVSPDGEWVVLRTRAALTFYPSAEFFRGDWRAARRVDLTPLKEPQGEGVTFGRDGALVLVGEGSGESRAGTFARFTCPPG